MSFVTEGTSPQSMDLPHMNTSDKTKAIVLFAAVVAVILSGKSEGAVKKLGPCESWNIHMRHREEQVAMADSTVRALENREDLRVQQGIHQLDALDVERRGQPAHKEHAAVRRLGREVGVAQDKLALARSLQHKAQANLSHMRARQPGNCRRGSSYR